MLSPYAIRPSLSSSENWYCLFVKNLIIVTAIEVSVGEGGTVGVVVGERIGTVVAIGQGSGVVVSVVAVKESGIGLSLSITLEEPVVAEVVVVEGGVGVVVRVSIGESVGIEGRHGMAVCQSRGSIVVAVVAVKESGIGLSLSIALEQSVVAVESAVEWAEGVVVRVGIGETASVVGGHGVVVGQGGGGVVVAVVAVKESGVGLRLGKGHGGKGENSDEEFHFVL